ncbi:MAG: hypothetical protein ACREI2_06200 [Nitrospiraceae bacterium]
MTHRASSDRSLSNTALAQVLVLGLVTVYAALSLLAVACPVDAAPTAGGHHHHGQSHHGTAAHVLLCAWACQANPPIALNSFGIHVQPVLLLVGMVIAFFLLTPFTQRERIRARSPPSLLRSR